MITEVKGWKDSRGVLHDDKRSAEKAEGRIQLDQLLGECVSGYDYSIDIEQVVARKDQLLEALHNA